MKKQFLFILIAGVDLQTYAMEIESYKETAQHKLLVPCSLSSEEIIQLSLTTTESHKNNQPISNIQNDIKTYRTIALSNEKNVKTIPLLEEKNKMEIIPLDNRQDDNKFGGKSIEKHDKSVHCTNCLNCISNIPWMILFCPCLCCLICGDGAYGDDDSYPEY